MINNKVPHNTEAEQAVLGAMLIDKEMIPRVVKVANENSFYHAQHREIYNSILELFKANKPVDTVTLVDHLSKENQLDAIGGVTYIEDIKSIVPSAGSIDSYLELITDTQLLRSLIDTCSDTVSEAIENNKDAKIVLERCYRSVFELTNSYTDQTFIKTGDLILPIMSQIDEAMKNKGSTNGVPSGFSALDRLTLGFQKGDLIIVAGRPSMGKTAIALNMATHVALKEKKPVGIFSFEMSNEQLMFRLLSSESGIDMHQLKQGDLKDTELTKMSQSIAKIGEAPIYIDDTSGVTTLDMKIKARQLMKENNIELLIVDYLQLIHCDTKSSNNRTQEIGAMARDIKSMARELKIPIILLSQLSRGVETRVNKRPNLSDLRESGEIEQVADLVIFLYRDSYYNPESIDHTTEVAVSKHRNGPTGIVRVGFKKELTKFADLEIEED